MVRKRSLITTCDVSRLRARGFGFPQNHILPPSSSLAPGAPLRVQGYFNELRDQDMLSSAVLADMGLVLLCKKVCHSCVGRVVIPL